MSSNPSTPPARLDPLRVASATLVAAWAVDLLLPAGAPDRQPGLRATWINMPQVALTVLLALGIAQTEKP